MMKSWISICNQGVVDRAHFIFFKLAPFYYVLSSQEKSSRNAKVLLKWMVEEQGAAENCSEEAAQFGRRKLFCQKSALPRIVLKKLPSLGGKTSNQ